MQSCTVGLQNKDTTGWTDLLKRQDRRFDRITSIFIIGLWWNEKIQQKSILLSICMNLFWFCRKIELFWKHLIASLKDPNCLSDDYLLNNLVVLGLKPDTSKNKVVINFVLLLVRFHIWVCRSKGNIPTIENFKPFLQQYKEEIKPFSL